MTKNTKKTETVENNGLREIIDYAVVSADSTKGLTEKVQAAIKSGWRPVGPAQSDSTEHTSFYIQTLVLYGA